MTALTPVCVYHAYPKWYGNCHYANKAIDVQITALNAIVYVNNVWRCLRKDAFGFYFYWYGRKTRVKLRVLAPSRKH